MLDTFQNPEIQEKKRKASPIAIAMVVVAAAAILATLWFLFEPVLGRRGTGVQETLNISNMSPAEQEYAEKIEIGNIALSRAENFLHQEVTTLSGEVYNGGTEAVHTLDLTAEFYDDMSQVVLRETRRVLATPHAVLSPGGRRAFEISFEHLPDTWNMQTPVVRVSYLQLVPRKH